MNKIMYAAKLSWGNPSLVKITIVKETEHTISVSDKQILIGESYSQYFGNKRVFKNSLNVFDTLTEAARYLIKELHDANDNHLQQVEENNSAIDKLEALKDD